jgi:hypothetical protein
MLKLPETIDEITRSFVTDALAGRHPGTKVDEVEVVDVRQGSASSLRLRLSYADNPNALPTSMYLKGDFIDHEFTSPIAFASEARFYDAVAPELPDEVNVPDSYFGAVDDSGQAIVLLEDLLDRGARFGQADTPMDADTVDAGLGQLAALHADHWLSPSLASADWLDEASAVGMLMRYLVQPIHFDDYIARDRAAQIPEPLRDRVAVERALEAMFETDEQLPWTFVHGDPHLGNTFVEPDGRPGFVDWQGVARGPYIWDVTYFLTGALDTEVRRVNEQDLLRDYLGRLAASGVDAPSFNDAWLAHRRHMMHGYLSILTPDQMQPDSFATIMGGRFARAADDLETLSAFH